MNNTSSRVVLSKAMSTVSYRVVNCICSSCAVEKTVEHLQQGLIEYGYFCGVNIPLCPRKGL